MCDNLKICNKCGQEFPNTLEFFYKTIDGNIGGYCKSCRRKQSQGWRNVRYANDEKYRIYQRERGRKQWREINANPERLLQFKCNKKYNTAKQINELKPYYVAYLMGHSVKETPIELIETKRLIIQLKRELKNNNIKIR